MLLLDQNLSFRLKRLLGDALGSICHVSDLGLTNASDRAIWDWAHQAGCTIVSCDFDFFELSQHLGHPPKVILLQFANVGTEQIANRLKEAKELIQGFEADPDTACLLL